MPDPIPFPITLTFVALCSIAMLPLISWIGLRRAAVQTLHGHGDDPALRRRIRIHGNFIETAPLAILAVWGGELLQFPSLALWAAVGSFALGRLLHAALFDSTRRGLAMLFTTGPALFLGVAILIVLWG